MNSLSTCPQTGPHIYTGKYVALSTINVQDNRACLVSSFELAYDWLYVKRKHSGAKMLGSINAKFSISAAVCRPGK